MSFLHVISINDTVQSLIRSAQVTGHMIGDIVKCLVLNVVVDPVMRVLIASSLCDVPVA